MQQSSGVALASLTTMRVGGPASRFVTASTTDELIEVFWPDASRKGVANVRQAVHTLRDRLEPGRPKHGGSAFVVARSGGYELERTAVWIDADDFEASVRAGARARADGDLETAEAALSRAAGLYRGDFLAEEIYADWAFGERDRLRDLAGHAPDDAGRLILCDHGSAVRDNAL